jgi:hypothetical protein
VSAFSAVADFCDQSLARFCVCTRLVSRTWGCAWLAGNSTYSILAPSWPSCTSLAVPLLEKLLSSERW